MSLRSEPRDLWVDGVRWDVPQAVWAYVQTIRHLNGRFAARIVALLDGEPLTGDDIRWTATLKEIVVRLASSDPAGHALAMRIFDLSAEELDGWIARYGEHGRAGLMATRVQDLQDGEAAA